MHKEAESNDKQLLYISYMLGESKMNQEILLEDESPRLEGTWAGTGEEQNIRRNSPAINEATRLNLKRGLVQDVHRSKRKVWCRMTHNNWNTKCKKRESRWNVDRWAISETWSIAVFGVSKLKWTEMRHFHSETYKCVTQAVTNAEEMVWL